MAQKLLLLALAGAMGTIGRYALGGLMQRWMGTSFPWGTLVVNGAGCLLFGVLWALGSERMAWSAETRTVLLIGFLGAFTTFSTFAAESGLLLADREWLFLTANVLASNVCGIGLFLLGLAVGRWI